MHLNSFLFDGRCVSQKKKEREREKNKERLNKKNKKHANTKNERNMKN